MKRRTFLSGLAAATANPAIPGGLLARAATAPVAAVVDGNMYQLAVYWVGLWQHNSAAMLKYRFNLDDQAATDLFETLIERQVIAKPDARGMAKVMISTHRNPFSAHKMAGVMEKSRHAAAAESFDATKHRPSRFSRQQKPLEEAREVVSYGAMDVRGARASDVPALALIWAEGFEAGQPDVLISQKEAKLRKRLEKLVVAGPIGAPTGYALVGAQGLDEVFVAKAHRNQGLGSKLLGAAEAVLEADVASVVCAAEDRTVQGFLEANGYDEILGPPKLRAQDEVHFMKLLSAPPPPSYAAMS